MGSNGSIQARSISVEKIFKEENVMKIQFILLNSNLKHIKFVSLLHKVVPTDS